MLLPFFAMMSFVDSSGPRPRFCPGCGQAVSAAARFCRACGQRLGPPALTPPQQGLHAAAKRERSALRKPVALSLLGCGALVILGLVAAGGYVGYRYWWAPSGAGPIEQAAGQEADADWGGEGLRSPDLGTSEREIRPHLERVARAFGSGNVAQAQSLSLPETRDQIRSSFEGHPERMQRFAQLLANARLTVAEGDLAEFEFTENGRAFAVTFQRLGNTWVLHSF